MISSKNMLIYMLNNKYIYRRIEFKKRNLSFIWRVKRKSGGFQFKIL